MTSDERGKENLDGLENLEGLDHLGDDGKALANARGGNPDNRGQFSTQEGPHGHGESRKAREKREKSEFQEKAFKAGTAGMKAVESGQDCPDFMPGVHTKTFSVDHVAFHH